MQDPFEKFAEWFEEANKAEDMAEAMSIATVDDQGRPSVRMVLLKDHGPDGFTFYTNLDSRKGQEIAHNPNMAFCFHWKSLARQIRIEGPVSQVSDEEADAYFASRARDSQIGAWASKQSQPMEGRFEFEARILKYTTKFGISAVPRPPYWSGFRLKPRRIEFWRDRKFRLHDRHIYKINDQGNWETEILYP
ncbi:MAG: pyridoxamine 5'-phosphate oxidase [Alphaproteobacteria bacterium]|nr:pyridoxamine 5'-phosphate oxidase [Alphaproteobacteria bacterium]HPF45429.1 pyridoxamine 5'-phosphate oxidase [Emcibacteraceae bacterium]HRW29579.1 pyridoxamine 5'-phosphate oxidase [Emcibacteraceae bacterium]